MMTSLDQALFKEVIDFLIPFMNEEDERRKWLRLAFDEKIYSKIDFTGAADDFTVRVAGDLIKHGEVLPGRQAIIELLGTIKNAVGTDQQQAIELICHKLGVHFNSGMRRQRFLNQESFIKAESMLPLGDLLPYMVNREDQEYKLKQLLPSTNSKVYAPVVCIIYGDEFQCHEMFLERLKVISLPRILNLRFQQNTVLLYRLVWPNRFQDMAELHDKLRKHLADEICGYSGAEVDEIHGELNRNPAPVLIHTHLCTEDWQQHGINAIGAFLEFWRHWPPLKQHLLICLCIKYKAHSRGKTNSLLERLFFMRSARSNLDTLVVQALTTLNYTKFAPLVCIPLPKLEDVTFKDATDWARSKEMSTLCRQPNLLAEIKTIFAEWEKNTKSKTIPMEIISSKLEQLVAKHRR